MFNETNTSNHSAPIKRDGKTPPGKFYSPGIKEATKERLGAYFQGGKNIEHDSQWTDGELAQVAMYYACPPQYTVQLLDGAGSVVTFPSDRGFKNTDYPSTNEARITQLSKAAALIVAEIDRLIYMDNNQDYLNL
jgi:hypothetical protein